ncbi:MAG: putative dehydrogenase [Verrucomicrobia bacterium]|nr:putative dehydrogenase [Verrucomicrobiota bacterium]
MKKIRFGILGSGYMGRTHAEAVLRLADDAALTAVSGGRRAPGLAARFGIPEEPTAEALIRRADVDAVIVATPHHLHPAATILALEQGKHVLVEKPLATSVDDCDRMIAAATRSKRILATGYHQRFRPNNREARRLIQAGAIGRLQTVQVSMPSQQPVGMSNFGSDWSWWNDPASVGHLVNSFPHGIDLLRWCTGAEVSTVTAFCRTLLPDIKVEDTTMALAEFSNGVIASLYSSRALPAPPFPGEAFRCRFVGTTGLIDLDPYDELKIADEKGWRLVSKQPAVGHESADTAFGESRMQAYRDQMKAFIVAIRGEKVTPEMIPVGTGPDGRVAVAVCHAMLASSQQRRWVELSSPAAQPASAR